ncbi:hypothetical protein CYLTODRAFT_427459 [Cylindrobasidium torrendii FP15055 ss-10]|uniref:Uncharacterized protein n=1 Tax=Cylindrobasidium torrendii FP15055 ss-10 TaxID=1314674 RepID=A0A0D7ATP2_9AGAR|nr:hypothetical protein CYLTODRAFT_427459 [Cylindrobasidium torrendii FP15055 ss-10]
MDFFYTTQNDELVLPVRRVLPDGTIYYHYNEGRPLISLNPLPTLGNLPADEILPTMINYLRRPEYLDVTTPWMAYICPDEIVGRWQFSKEAPVLQSRSDGAVEWDAKERAQAMGSIRRAEWIMTILLRRSETLGTYGPFPRRIAQGAYLSPFESKRDALLAVAFAKYHLQVVWAFIKWCYHSLARFKGAIGEDLYDFVEESGMHNFRNRGVVIRLEEDVFRANYVMYARSEVPFYILSCPALFKEERFLRLNPDLILAYAELRKSSNHLELADVLRHEGWDEDRALDFDIHLQLLKHEPYAPGRVRGASFLSAYHRRNQWRADYYVVDHEGWHPRAITEDDSDYYFGACHFYVYEVREWKIKRITFHQTHPWRYLRSISQHREAEDYQRRIFEEKLARGDPDITDDTRSLLAARFAPRLGEIVEWASGNIVQSSSEEMDSTVQYGISQMFHYWKDDPRRLLLEDLLYHFIDSDNEKDDAAVDEVTRSQCHSIASSRSPSPALLRDEEMQEPALATETVLSNAEIQNAAVIVATKEIPTLGYLHQPKFPFADYSQAAPMHIESSLYTYDRSTYNLAMSYASSMGIIGEVFAPFDLFHIPEFDSDVLVQAHLWAPPYATAVLKTYQYIYPGYRDIRKTLRYALMRHVEFSLAWDQQALEPVRVRYMNELFEVGRTLKDDYIGMSLRPNHRQALVIYGYGGDDYTQNWTGCMEDLARRPHMRGLASQGAIVEAYILPIWTNGKYIIDYLQEGPSPTLAAHNLGDGTTLISASDGSPLQRERATESEKAVIRGVAENGEGKLVSRYPSTRIMMAKLSFFRAGIWNESVQHLLDYITLKIKEGHPTFLGGRSDKEWGDWLHRQTNRHMYSLPFTPSSQDVEWGVRLMKDMYPANWNGVRIRELEDDETCQLSV